MHKESCFITLTYNDENLPAANSLQPQDFTDFLLRLKYVTGKKIRYYMVGEYGELGRPHFHALLFGHSYSDQKLYMERHGQRTYLSKTLTQQWGKGFTSVQPVTMGTARYAASYVQKKVGGRHVTPGRHPEYSRMSRRPGIGSTWLDKFINDVYPHDHVVSAGQAIRPPRYYDKRCEIISPSLFEKTHLKRNLDSQAKKNDDGIRLAVREANAIDQQVVKKGNL